MSESEIRKLLKRACDELDRYKRQAGKAILPGAVGASLALTGCAGTAKNEPTVDPGHTDTTVQTVAEVDAGVTVPDPPAVADAAVPIESERPPYYDIPKPYMAPDAVPLYQTLDRTRVG